MKYPLEPSREEMTAMASDVAQRIAEFISDLPEAPAAPAAGAADLALSLRHAAPESPGQLDELLEIVERGAGAALNTTGPGYMAYVPGGGLFSSALATFFASALNRFVNIWNAAPVFAQIESTVIRWLCDQFDYPPEAMGILTTGGSMANFSSIVAARKELLQEEFLEGILYVSDQVHLSVTKAAMLAGFPERNVRAINTDRDLRMDLGTLRQAIAADKSSGRTPFYVVASAGTTNTGTVDPIGEIAAIARGEGLWMHADAAYGGFFQLTDRGRRAFDGIERADSITLDPHKGMFLPYGTGCLLMKNGSLLRAAHSAGGDYLQDLDAESDIPSFTEYSPELSRDFRGLKVWLPVMLHGLRAFRDALNEKLDLAATVHKALRSTKGFEVPWALDLSTVAFRYIPRSGDPDAFNRRLLERINASQRIFLSSTSIRGTFYIRVCILSHRTHRDRVDEGIEIIKKAAADLDR